MSPVEPEGIQLHSEPDICVRRTVVYQATSDSAACDMCLKVRVHTSARSTCAVLVGAAVREPSVPESRGALYLGHLVARTFVTLSDDFLDLTQCATYA
jgi:hypothetical protein